MRDFKENYDLDQLIEALSHNQKTKLKVQNLINLIKKIDYDETPDYNKLIDQINY